MSDEDALLRAICADPADDTARLVFADYLQEHGGIVGAAWAYVIRRQIELARLVDDVAEATAARVRLLDVPFWRAQWLGRLGLAGDGLLWQRWERGFPMELTVNADELSGLWPRLVRVPFTTLTVREATDDAVEELVAHPELARVSDLRLESPNPYRCDPLGDRSFLALAACPHLSGLRFLTARSAVISDYAAEVVIDAPHLANVDLFFARCAYWHRDRRALSPGVRERLERRFTEFTLS